MPTVAIEHTNQRHRSFERVLGLLRDALDHLGGIEAFVKPGEIVVIKPDPATDTLIVGALIHLVQNAGAATVQVAESSGHIPKREVELPEGKVLRRVLLPVPLLEADVIIAVPKARTQYFDVISGAMQMWVGEVNHNSHELAQSDEHMIGGIADVMSILRPDLCVTDALICGEGDGPWANLPHWCGCILASADPVATDVAIARLLGRDPKKLRFAAAGEERGLGSREPVVWLGTNVEKVAFQAWPAHEGFGHLPINVLVGEGVTISGTVGHVKSALDNLVRQGLLDQAISANGTPTIMIGGAEDPDFELHVQEGPYLVFDDVARPKYKHDPRVFFVPGHPVLDTAMSELMRGLRVDHESRLDAESKKRAAAVLALLGAVTIGTVLGIRAFGKRR